MSGRLSLTKVEQRQVDAAAAVFKPWGLVWRVEMGGKHLAMVVEGPRGVRGRMTIVCTPRDDDVTVFRARTAARRLVADINRRLGLG